jgi:ribosomal protein L4
MASGSMDQKPADQKRAEQKPAAQKPTEQKPVGKPRDEPTGGEPIVTGGRESRGRLP